MVEMNNKITEKDIVFGLAKLLTKVQDSLDARLLHSVVVCAVYILWRLYHSDILRAKAGLNDLEDLL